MGLVSSSDIRHPRLEVAVPGFVVWSLALVFLVIIVFVLSLPVIGNAMKTMIVSLIALVSFGVVRNLRRGDCLTTMQVNGDGLFFQADDYRRYYHVPWECTGLIEKAVFPLNRRGLRFEVLGEVAEALRCSGHVGNVVTEGDRTFVYTIPQLRNRDRLIRDIQQFRALAGVK